MSFNYRLRAIAKVVYHRLPLPQDMKWRLRELLNPVLHNLIDSPSLTALVRTTIDAMINRSSSAPLIRDIRREAALKAIMEQLAKHAASHGPVTHWIALPFLSTGGAEMVALNMCRGLRSLLPDASVALFVTDRNLVSERMVIPEWVQLVVLDEYLDQDPSYARKQALLHELLLAAQPRCFHNINSEVAWHLILQEGERLKRYTHLFASIFAFQFATDGHRKIGYAASFLKHGMPHLTGLLSDNQRFIDDAVREYGLGADERSRMTALYQPCRFLTEDAPKAGLEQLAMRRAKQNVQMGYAHRPQVLWAGRLDAEKRIDLFLEVVRRCSDIDFRVFGQVVLEDGSRLPSLPNLSYEGPFSSPLEWLEKFEFDAFLFTSRWEGMPNILIEVGALGIPVIAPTVGGVSELVSPKTGFPLPERPSVADYEHALRAVTADREQATLRATRLRYKVLERHTWKSFLTALAAVPGYVGQQTRAPAEQDHRRCEAPSSDILSPLISVVIPCYNQARYLNESISSALAACSHPMEIIVVDDGSTDSRTTKYLVEAERLAPDAIRIHRQENQGLSGARNTGIALARGRFIQLLDADDLLTPGKIDAQIAQFHVNPSFDVAVSNFLLCDESRSYYNKPEEAIARFDLTEQDFLYRWERGFAIPIHCGLFRRETLSKIRFDTHTRAKEDWLFWTTLAMAGSRFGYMHGHWAIYRQHEGSMRRSFMNMGRSWLQAGLKIDAMLAGREPGFFESVVSWFEQCYRAHPDYRAEVAALQASAVEQPSAALDDPAHPTTSFIVDPDAIIRQLSSLEQATEPPLISVVVPIYGHYEHLQNCLESLANQMGVSMEIVCVDDASPDPRVTNLMLALKDRLPRLKIQVQQLNGGISETQNIAVSLASGEFVAFVDCDDALEAGALATVRDYLLDHPEVDYLSTDRTDMDEFGQTIRLSRYGGYDNLRFTTQENIPADLLDGMVSSHLKVIRRSVYQEVGGSDPSYSGVQDWDLALKCAANHMLHHLPLPLYRHRVHSKSVTRSDMVSQFRRTNQVRRHHATLWLRQGSEMHPLRNQKTFRMTEFPFQLADIKKCWQMGLVCVADTSGKMSIEQLNFLREFNSYFDQIQWNDPTVPTSLYGYLWDEQVLTPLVV